MLNQTHTLSLRTCPGLSKSLFCSPLHNNFLNSFFTLVTREKLPGHRPKVTTAGTKAEGYDRCSIISRWRERCQALTQLINTKRESVDLGLRSHVRLKATPRSWDARPSCTAPWAGYRDRLLNLDNSNPHHLLTPGTQTLDLPLTPRLSSSCHVVNLLDV